MVEVLFPTLDEDRDFIQIHHHELVGEGSQDDFHQPHEGCGGIPQPERHDQLIEKALLVYVGSLPYITGFYWYLVVTKLQVNIAEIFGPLELV